MCRPRKNVLIYCYDPDRLGIARFVVGNHTKFSAYSAQTFDEVCAAVKQRVPGFFSAIVIIRTHKDDRSLYVSALASEGDIPAIFLNDVLYRDTTFHNIPHYFPQRTPVADWMERLRVITGRKRGPKMKKGAHTERSKRVGREAAQRNRGSVA